MPEPSLGNTPSQTPFATLDPLGFEGRIGRLRFLVWSTVITLIAIVTGVLVLLAVNVSPTLVQTNYFYSINIVTVSPT